MAASGGGGQLHIGVITKPNLNSLATNVIREHKTFSVLKHETILTAYVKKADCTLWIGIS